MTSKLPSTAPTASPAKLDLLLDRLAGQVPQGGRLVFGLDATMSRQPTWDRACMLQAEMFAEAASIGGLEIQLIYFRGESECRASGWMIDGKRLGDAMRRMTCVGGYTQIRKVLDHAKRECDKSLISALVYVGDAAEESLDTLCAGAHELRKRGVKVFAFQEGDDDDAEKASARSHG
jgi:hypothetical protein